MAILFSTNTKKARLQAIKTSVGNSPIMKIYSGTVPAAITDTPAGDILASLTLPADWLGTAVEATISKLGTWSGSAIVSGTATFFRIYKSDGVTEMVQGTVGESGTDAIINSAIIVAGQTVTVTSFVLAEGN